VPDQHEEDIFDTARRIESAEDRRLYVQQACGDDRLLRARVAALLRVYDEERSFLQPPTARFHATVSDPVREGPGTHVGPYQLLELLGEGGFGVVFRAQQHEPVRRQVALKVLKPGMDTRQVVARFEAERQALALMDHPHIATVLDGGETAGGRPYFVMELVKGIPITDFCDQNRLGVRERLRLFVDVCKAVQHAHQKGVIHRDLKPSNVLVTVHDATPVVKVIDFGVAKALGQRLTDKTLVTHCAQVVGTPLYMSPEQVDGGGLDIDTRADIYALGVLLYELLTGKTPFNPERLETVGFDELRRIIREEEPSRPSARITTVADAAATAPVNSHGDARRLRRLLRGELDWIVMKALEKDRDRRYETATAFALDVQRYLADEPVEACPPGAGYRLWKFARRNQGSLAVAAGLFLALTVTAASVGWAARDRAARRAEAEQAEAARKAKVEGQVRDSLNSARTLLAENKLTAARAKLAQARAQLGNDGSALGDLAAEVAADEAELDRFQRFLDLLERAHQAETPLFLEPTLADGSDGSTATPRRARAGPRRPAAAVPVLLEALRHYDVLGCDDWTSTLEGSLLGRQQVEQIRRLAYEELIWLADEVLRRRQEHGSERTLSPEAAARRALVYLGKAESAHRPTQALYALRARCRKALGDEAAARADAQRAGRTPATRALDHALRGRVAYDANQLAEGVQAFEAALRLEPTHYGSMIWLGYCLCDLGRGPEDFTGAVRVFTGCILKRPDHALAYYCRANAYRNLRRCQEAVADYSRAIELDPKYACAWNNRGAAYGMLGRLEQALADCTRAVELDPKNACAWNNRGFAHWRLGRPAQTVADLSRAVELDPTYAPAWYSRGFAYSELGQPDRAVADYSKAIELDPADARAWNNRGVAHGKLGQLDQAVADLSRAIELNSKDARAWYNRGFACNALGRPDQAVADLSRAVELDPTYAPAWYSRGFAYSALRQPDRAVADYSKAIELDPNHVRAWNDRGVAYGKLGRPDKALADCSRAVELDPKDARAWGNRGVACNDLGRPHQAVTDLSKAIELDPTCASAWNNRGVAHWKLGRRDRAVADYSKAIELDPKDAQAWSNRGVVHNELDQPDRAVADYSKAIELDPKDAQAWSGRGVAYGKLGRWDQALADCSRAVELDPMHARAWNNRGIAHGKLARADKALADHSRAIELDPMHAQAWFNRGVVHNKLGKPDQAVADFSRAIELAPNERLLAQAYLRRAHTNYRLSRFEQARADYQTFLKRAPDHARAHNDLAWLLATCPDAKLRDPDRAVELARRAVQLAPKERDYWNTLGVAHYRAGDGKAAVAALDKARELGQGRDAYDQLFLAMAHRKLGNHDAARKAYEQAVQWLEKNQETLAKDKVQVEELRRFRAEAEEALDPKKQ
jgi:tetratricopeptide (TPR) repeat protein/serine/threonine protein kinase